MPERKPILPDDRPTSECMTREKLPPCRRYLSTGSTLLDLAIADRYPGGVGSGRITHIYGDSSTAKTVLAQEILGSAQRAGGYAVFEDSEYTLDFGRARDLFGLRISAEWDDDDFVADAIASKVVEAVGSDPEFLYRVPDTVESLYDDEIGPLIELSQGGKIPRPVAVAVDSMSALASVAEQSERLDKGSYGTSRAKANSAAFRKYIRRLATSEVAVVVIDQTREKIGVLFGSSKTVSGGNAIKFYASTRVILRHAGDLKNKAEKTVGVKIKFKIEKNKIGPPMREGFFYVVFEYGVDDLRANIEWLADKARDSAMELKGSWLAWKGENLGQGIEAAIAKAEALGLEGAIAAEVARVWAIEHAAEPRKRRHSDE